ncbi:MAG: hypothetical protein K8I00_12210, partial [Candidatus Omnitrophica bacterium]|nr:hypothetical protein [Candidatus Omnitrophota bacterium]
RKHQLAEFQEGKPTMPLLSNEEFCADYAHTAVAQYDYAITNGLPGIVPPVWSNDRDHHYRWCLTVSRDEVMQGQKLRQSYIDERTPAGAKKFGQLADAIKHIDAGKFTPNGVTAVIKAQPNKQFDPGRGP